MTGLEYTDRLIEDINRSADIRGKVADPFSQVKMIGITGQANLKDFWSAMNVWGADAHLDILSQFININERFVDHDKGDRVTIDVWRKNVIENRERIAEVFQQTIDNKELIDAMSGKPIRDYLIEQLDCIHQAAN